MNSNSIVLKWVVSVQHLTQCEGAFPKFLEGAIEFFIFPLWHTQFLSDILKPYTLCGSTASHREPRFTLTLSRNHGTESVIFLHPMGAC